MLRRVPCLLKILTVLKHNDPPSVPKQCTVFYYITAVLSGPVILAASFLYTYIAPVRFSLKLSDHLEPELSVHLSHKHRKDL